MAGSIAKLVVSLGANISGFETDMKRAARTNKQRMRDIERTAEAAGKKIAIAFTAAAGSLTAIVAKSVQTADQMSKMAQRLGTSTEALSELSHVAELSGVQFNQLTIGMQRMERRIAEVAALGKGEAKQALEQLGLSAEKLSKLPVDKQFEAVAEELSKVQSESERVRLAFKLFDSEGVALVQTMGEGAAGIQRMREEARQLGKVISSETAASAVEFKDNLTRLQAQLEGVGIQIASQVIPTISKWVDKLVESGTVMQAAQSIGRGLVTVFEAIASAAESLAKHSTAAVSALSGFLTLKALPAFFLRTHPLISLTAIAVGGLVGAFIKFRNDAQQTQRVLADLEGSIEATTAAWVNAASAAELISRQTQLRKEWIATDRQLIEVQERLAQLLEQTPDDLEQYHAEIRQLREEEQKLIKTQGEGVKRLAEIRKRLEDLKKEAKGAGTAVERFGDDLSDVVVTAKRATTYLTPLPPLVERFADELENLAEVTAENEDLWRDITQEQERYERSLRDIEDAFNPVAAAGREIGQVLADLTRGLKEGRYTWEEYTAIVNFAIGRLDDVAASAQGAAKGVDFMQTAIDESIRILERTFADLFDGLINDSLDAWEVIESGFKSLVSTIARTPIRALFEQDGKPLSEVIASGGQIDWSELGGELIASIGNILGLGLADNIFGQLGSSLGSVAGRALGTKLLTSLGSFAGPIGSALGAILGSIFGNALGGLFERDLRFTLGGQNVGTGAQRLRSPLADVIGLGGQGGFGDLNDPSTLGGQLGKAIVEFDTQLAELLKASAVDDSTFQRVIANLQSWSGTWGEGVEAVDVLQSRFAAVLNAFSSDIQSFVRGTQDFEQQVERFGVALSLDKFIKDNPEVFADRAVGEILAVVERFQTGARTISQAFDEFAQVANVVISITAALKDFAGSDLRADFRAIINPIGLEQSLENVRQAVLQSIRDFDGSIESLQTIGELSMVVRQGELQLLQKIDAIQKGLNASLDRLKEDLLGIGAEPKSTQQILFDASRLVDTVRRASNADDIAKIGQQFEALIRQIPEADVLAIGPQLLVSLVTQFQTAANKQLALLSESTISEGESLRSVIDTFISQIGDPLDIIAASLDGANIPDVMEQGLENINATVGTIGPQVANAIQQSLGNVNVTVVVQDSGLVTV